MRLRLVFGVVGTLLRLFALAFVPPFVFALVAWIAGHAHVLAVVAFLVAGLLAAGVGTLLARGFRAGPLLRRSEALGVVAFTWFTVAVAGAVPYLFYGLGVVDAFFESMSGLTTTGATILTDFGRYDHAFYLWRAMTQWFGGLGVIALFVVVLPRLGIAGRQIFFAEASTASGEALSPQIRETARRLWILYIALTAIQACLLVVTGYGLYDAIVHSLTTMSAGGFSPNPRSIEGYQNPGAEWVIIVFMILSGTSFTLQYRAFTKRPSAFARDLEFMVYLTVMVVLGLGAAAFLLRTEGGAAWSLRTGMFQLASLMSSTGYASADFNGWSQALKTILILGMVVGGCAGSACGGAKVIRYILTTKWLRRELTQVLHPRAVISIRYRGVRIPSGVMRAVTTLVFLYILGYGVTGAAVLLIEGDVPVLTGFSAALACLGNIGPAFGKAGPMGSYADFHAVSKTILALSMWVGRLEIVTVIALLHPHVWKNLVWRRVD